MPVRTGQPQNLRGLVDKLNSPMYSTSFGLLQWAISMHDHQVAVSNGGKRRSKNRNEKNAGFDTVKNWMKRLLP
jgi:cell division ATPase FtsA